MRNNLITEICFQVITLSGTPERRDFMKKLLTDQNIPFRIRVFEKHKNPTLGAFISHLSIYAWAKRKKLPYVAILEDNVTAYDKLTKDSFVEIENFINNYKDWNQLYIGGSVDPSFNQVEKLEGVFNGRIYQDFNNLHGTNAYIISAKHYNEILSHPQVKERFKKSTNKGIAFDVFMRQFPERFIHRPFLLPHRIVPSTINSHLNLVRNVYFYPGVVKLCQFLFFRNIQVKETGIVIIGITVLSILYILYKIIKPFILDLTSTLK